MVCVRWLIGPGETGRRGPSVMSFVNDSTVEGLMVDNDVVRDMISDEELDRLMDRVDAEGLELLGPEGVLTELTSRIMNRAMDVELSDELGYERGDPAGRGSGNNRNGTSPKTVLTDVGAVPVAVPRDRNGDFEPKLVPKHHRRIDGFNDLVIGLVARGMTTRATSPMTRSLNPSMRR